MIGPMFDGLERDRNPMLKEFIAWSAAEPSLSGPAVMDAWIRRDAVRAEFLEQMRRYPILLCPPAAIPAFRHRERRWVVEGKPVEYLDAWSYAEFFNVLGNQDRRAQIHCQPVCEDPLFTAKIRLHRRGQFGKIAVRPQPGWQVCGPEVAAQFLERRRVGP